MLHTEKATKTRLIQLCHSPLKFFFVFVMFAVVCVAVFVLLVVVTIDIVIAVVIVVGPRHLNLKFGKNRVSNC